MKFTSDVFILFREQEPVNAIIATATKIKANFFSYK